GGVELLPSLRSVQDFVFPAFPLESPPFVPINFYIKYPIYIGKFLRNIETFELCEVSKPFPMYRK
ncbi:MULTISPECIES: hypothetical protein, partial [Lysinibacillus]|uniref:hypothetical protein n=1 Tax=Lysinibacillus TaxID=400634 RepID=UPI0019D4EFC3